MNRVSSTASSPDPIAGLSAPAPQSPAVVLRLAAEGCEADNRGFVVLSGPRSGSSLLRDCLNQHESIQCFGEIFRDRPIKKKQWRRLSGNADLTKEMETLHRSDVTGFWKLVLEKYQLDRPLVGAKLFYHHREGDPLWRYLASTRTPIVHLIREELIDSYLSFRLAKASQTWRQEKGASADAGYSRNICIALPHFETYCTKYRQFFDSATALFKDNPYLRVSYAAMANDRARTMEAVYSFLGVSNCETSPRLSKQLSRPREEVITNWSEVANFIAAHQELCVLR